MSVVSVTNKRYVLMYNVATALSFFLFPLKQVTENMTRVMRRQWGQLHIFLNRVDVRQFSQSAASSWSTFSLSLRRKLFVLGAQQISRSWGADSRKCSSSGRTKVHMERTGDGDDNNHDGNADHGGVYDQWIPRMFSIPLVFLSCSFLSDVLNND